VNGARPRLAAWLLLAACARSNAALLEELEGAPGDPRLDAVLDRPDQPVPALGEVRAVTLPMRGRLPTVEGRLNGVEIPMLLDTGTNYVSLSGAAARAARVHVPDRPAVEVIAPGYDLPHRLAVFETLELGGLAFGPGAATVPLREGRPGAIVGCSVLSRFAVTFDYRKDEVRLVPHGKPGYTNGLVTPVEVNGRSYWMLVDSGAARVVLEPWAALELGLVTPEEAAHHGTKAGEEREARRTKLRLKHVRVSGREFRDVDGLVAQTFGEERSESGLRCGGLLGLKPFGRLAWTLDYGAKRLTVEE
jgi:predicted aspartyl protease